VAIDSPIRHSDIWRHLPNMPHKPEDRTPWQPVLDRFAKRNVLGRNTAKWLPRCQRHRHFDRCVEIPLRFSFSWKASDL
jgi:hypothetical protein